jgi:hypothetical protein
MVSGGTYNGTVVADWDNITYYSVSTSRYAYYFTSEYKLAWMVESQNATVKIAYKFTGFED